MFETKSINKADGTPFFVLEDGEYDGIWGGYIVETMIENEKFLVTTKLGIRGYNVPVKVVIKDGAVWVRVKQ